VLGWLRRYFVAGILALAPLTITAWLLVKIFRIVDSWLRPLFARAFGFEVPGVGFVSTLVLVLVVGVLASNLVGREVLAALGRLLRRVPLASSIYVAVKQIGDAFMGSQRNLVERVVLFQWPHTGAWAMGFVTSHGHFPPVPGPARAYATVFYPTTPNPATGFVFFVPEDELVDLDLPVEDALKLAISGGAVTPTRVSGRPAPRPAAAGSGR
jgi:uncharacterized membrane protein